jgi:B12-binding domain/radical SAM domain protein
LEEYNLMPRPALILLHAPSVYDFRKEAILRGPVSDLVPSSSIFEMYPIGFTALSAHLEDHGFPVRIVNIAARMLRDAAFDAEKHIASLPSPLLFGIDLHWLPHAQGALALADIVRRTHPDTPIVFGGFSSTYYHQELVQYPQVDFVIRGDSTEEPLLMLVEALARGDEPHDVPNLTWKDAKGSIHVNPMSYSPPDLEHIKLDYRYVMRAAARDMSVADYLPFLSWFQYPIMPILTCRGCTLNCAGCGGSAYAFRLMHGREQPAYRSPESAAEDLHQIASVSNGPVFILGDLRQAGTDYADRFLAAAHGVDVPVIVELFWPAKRDYLAKVAKALPNFVLEISMESHDPAVRRAFGKGYKTEEMEESFRAALDLNCIRLDIFFMIGLPHQDRESVRGTAAYAESLLQRFGGNRQLRPFIGPMAPFVDPGSRAFEEPDRLGYHILFRSLEAHRQALLEPSWQFTLNYETNWMSRADIVASTYEVGLLFNEMKLTYGLVDASESARVQETLREGWRLAEEIARLCEAGDSAGIRALKPAIDQVNAVRVLEEESELNLPVSLFRFKALRLLGHLLSAWLGK